MSGDFNRWAVFSSVAIFGICGCSEVLCVNAVLHNLSEEVWCFWEALDKVFMCYMFSLHLRGRLSFQALWSALCLLCTYCLLSKCLQSTHVVSQGVIVSASVQLYSTCVDLSDSSWKPCSSATAFQFMLWKYWTIRWEVFRTLKIFLLHSISHNYFVSRSVW